MVQVDQFVEIRWPYFTALPTIEMPAKFQESPGQLTIVRNGSPFANQAFEPLRDLLREFLSG